jgi:altronate dehydratase small subunit
MNNLLMMHEKDNVAVCLADGKAGETLPLTAKDGSNAGSIKLLEDTPFAHKVALADIAAGEHITKYGELIGAAIKSIKVGQWVHTHNIEGLRGRGDKDDN